MIGRKVSHYRVVSELGRGGMGVVYRAQDETLGRDVALKILPADSVTDEQARRRLIEEARLASSLNHPHICTIYEASEAEGQIFFAMELVVGRSLREHIPVGGMPEESVARYGAQIADALAHAHERGVIHRDLKPANVVVTRDGRAKVLDFGVAQRVEPAQLDQATQSQASLTEGGRLAGTLAYMAPEQLRGEPADARSDIWALGVMLYEMASGGMPFSGATGFELSSAILRETPTQLPERVPPPLRAVIQRCLLKEPAQRYQHASEVRAALETLSTATAAPSTALAAPRSRAIPWKWPVVAAGILAIVAVALALNVGGLRQRLFAPAGPPKIESLAVLPLENLSGDPTQEYFADGMTEALITELSKISALKVISRTSVMQYKGVKKPMPQVAQELGVDALIEGSVLREGDQVRITVQLIHGSSDRHLWARSFDRELRGILALHSEVAQAIAEEIKVTLTPREQALAARVRPVDPEAYEAYLKGRYYWNQRTPEGFKKASEHFQRAVDSDPTYALAYAGLADNYVVQPIWGLLSPEEGYPRAKAAATRAIELDDSLAEPHATLGYLLRDWDWDWKAAEQAFRRALELNPNYATAHHWYALYLSSVGRHEQAVSEIKRARELDPLSIIINSNIGRIYYYARQYGEAEKAVRKALEMNANFAEAHANLGLIYLATERAAEAEASFQRAVELYPTRPEYRSGLAEACILTGKREEARRLLKELEKEAAEKYVSAGHIALVYGRLGEKARAFLWLEKCLEQRDWWNANMKVEPRFDFLRDDPRFQDLLRRMKFPP